MPKRKKYPKLPNGYGTIRYLGKNRRNCYAVHPPAEIEPGTGRILRQTPICYVDSWIKGFTVLTAIKAGTYTPGMEKSLEIENTGNLEDLANKVLADYNRVKGVKVPEQKTFKEVYDAFYFDKYESKHAKTYSANTIKATKYGFQKCADLHDKIFRDIRFEDLRNVLDNSAKRHAAQEHVRSLIRQMYAFAKTYDLCDKDYSENLEITVPDDDEHGEPFTIEDLKKLWNNSKDETVEFILIMCYSGFRISAYQTLEVNLEEKYFKGGIKTASSRDRVVPIHSVILPIVRRRIKKHGTIIPVAQNTVRKNMAKVLKNLGIKNHTPHDCRHTFSMLCEKYEVKENDRKRMLGHAFKDDITNAVYGHRSLEDLRTEIEKIKKV